MVSISSHNEDRRRRADSWLAQSENVDSDDEKFIFLWIAFNAAYGGEPGNTPESNVLGKFLDKILNRDNKKSMEKILFENISPTLFHQIMQNKYMFEPFWQSVRRETGKGTWKKSFDKDNEDAIRYHKDRRAKLVLEEILKRLYTLRNQIFHGGTTFAAGKGRDQLRDGVEIMARLVPAILAIMKNAKSDDWGTVAYPRQHGK